LRGFKTVAAALRYALLENSVNGTLSWQPTCSVS